MVQPTFPNFGPIGDSLTGGLYSTTKATDYVSLLAGLLNGYNASNATTTINYGVSGAQVGQSLPTLYGFNTHMPDIVVVEYGTDNALASPPTDLTTFENQLNELLDGITVNANHGGRWPMVVMCTTWNTNTGYTDFDPIIKKVAAERNYPVVDFYPIWTQSSSRGPAGVSVWQGTSDDFHPNDTGHQMIANAIFDALKPYLAFAYRKPRA